MRFIKLTEIESGDSVLVNLNRVAEIIPGINNKGSIILYPVVKDRDWMNTKVKESFEEIESLIGT